MKLAPPRLKRTFDLNKNHLKKNLARIFAPSYFLPRMQNTTPSLARCVLHVRAIHRNPSRFRFYVCGIMREFTGSFSGLLIVSGFALVILCELINLFF